MGSARSASVVCGVSASSARLVCEKVTCTWQSISPGISVRPPPSMTRASSAGSAASDTARMASPSTSTWPARQPAVAHVEHVHVLEQGSGSSWGCNVAWSKVAHNHAMSTAALTPSSPLPPRPAAARWASCACRATA
jgi:hypothetical protein